MEWIYIGMICVGFLVMLFGLMAYGFKTAEKNEEEINRILKRWPKDGK